MECHKTMNSILYIILSILSDLKIVSLLFTCLPIFKVVNMSGKLILSTLFGFTEKQLSPLAINLDLTFNFGKLCGGEEC